MMLTVLSCAAIALSTLCGLSHQSSPRPHEVGPANTPVSQGRKLRQGTVAKLVQGILASKGLQDFRSRVWLEWSRLSASQRRGHCPLGA